MPFKHDHKTFVGMSIVPCQKLISNTVGPINTIRVKYGHDFETWGVHGNGHQEKIEDTKALIRGRNSKKERPSKIGQQNKLVRNNKKKTTQKTRAQKHQPHKNKSPQRKKTGVNSGSLEG